MSDHKPGRFLAEIEGDLMFGEIPDDDIPNADDNAIDANNDETFGAEFHQCDADELEDYAAQTACLRLDDGWDQPGCSLAPDASQLPMPTFAQSVYGSSEFDPLLGTNAFDKLDSIWNNQTPSGNFGVWGNAPASDRRRTPSPNLTSNIGLIGFGSPHGAPGSTSTPKILPPKPPQARTLEDLESMHSRTEAHDSTQQLPMTALSAADLERRLLEDARVPHIIAQSSQVMSHGDSSQFGRPPSVSMMNPPPVSMNVIRPPPGNGHGNGMTGGQPPQMVNIPGGPLPPIPPLPHMFIPFIPGWMEYLAGRISFLPPGYPPVPPFLVHLMKTYKDPRIVMGMLQAAIHVPQRPLNPPMSPSPSQFGYQRKPPGMPSERTIEDLAFDQFAGYMSCKERQWLVKIQILQCQGSGNPFADDYYYACWRQKRLAEGWKPKEVKSVVVEKLDNKENMNGRSYHHRRYRERVHGSGTQHDSRDKDGITTKKFAGSLGLPSKSTTNNPRHLISFGTENVDVVDEDPDKRSAGSQKKLRTLLLKLEAASILVLECYDIRMNMSGNHPTLQRDSMSREVHDRVELINRELCGEELTRVLQIGKGRSLIARVMNVAAVADQARILAALFTSVFSISKKVHLELSGDLVPSIFSALLPLSREQMLVLISGLNVEVIRKSLVDKNLVCRDMLLNIAFMCSVKKATSSSPFFQWLRGPSADIDFNVGWTSSIRNWSDAVQIPREDVQNFSSWLSFLVPNPLQSTVASHLAAILLSQV